jgi:NitT/TauT family transport system substrate-binding protein
MKRSIAAAAISMLVMAVLAACGSSGSTDSKKTGPKIVDKLSVSYIANYESAFIVAIGVQKGFFEAAGLDVTTHEVQTGPVAVAAMNSGKLDIAYIGPGPTRLAVAGKAVIIGVNDISISDYVIAKKEIATMQDLRGKQVGYAVGTSSSLMLALALEKAGMTLADVKSVNISEPANIAAAYSSGRLPAAVTWAPFSATILKKVPDSHVLATDKDYYPELALPDTFTTTAKMLKERPDTVRRFMWAVAKANDWTLAHQKEAGKIIADYTQQPLDLIMSSGPPEYALLIPSKELATKYADGTAQRWYTTIANVYVKLGEFKTLPPPSQYIDFSAAIAASKRLSQSTYDE